MFITKKSLPRRTVLRGMGAAVALPLLDSMIPPFTALARTAANPVRRVGFVYFPMGMVKMDRWTPASTGVDFELSPVLKPLEPFRDSLLVVSNLARPAVGTHATSSAGWLSGVIAKRTEAEDVHVGTTIDQVIATHVGQNTLFPSLELATEDFTGYLGACDMGYSCAYMNTISWRSPTIPLPMEINPRAAFERMFGGEGSRDERVAQIQKDRSILDSVREDVTALERGLGPRDRSKLGEYLDHVREIEKRIGRSEQQTDARVAVPDMPLGVPESFEEHVTLMFDLLAVAYQADLTRVFTFMMAREASQRVYPDLGVADPHHGLSHHQNDPAKIATLSRINVYHVQLFAKFLDTLRRTNDGDGSLLDHSTVFYGSGMSDGNGHTPAPLPLVAVGTGAGLIKGNRHLHVPEQTPISNLYLSLADKFGIDLDHFGLSTGRLEL
jgi:hypothetical protein